MRYHQKGTNQSSNAVVGEMVPDADMCLLTMNHFLLQAPHIVFCPLRKLL